MKRLFKILTILLSIMLLSSIAVIADSYTVTAQWDQSDTTNLKEWKLFWSDTSGGPYTEIMVIPYDPAAGGPTYTSPASVDVTGPQGTMVKKYFVMIACGDIPQADSTTKYECSVDSNQAEYDFWIPAGKFSIPLNFEIKAQ